MVVATPKTKKKLEKKLEEVAKSREATTTFAKKLSSYDSIRKTNRSKPGSKAPSNSNGPKVQHQQPLVESMSFVS